MNKPMTLSEAIRLGAMRKPQGFGPDSMYAVDRSCALAAACDATGIQRVSRGSYYPYNDLCERFHILKITVPGKPWYVVDEIWRRNDSHSSRDAIADWVETLERQQEQSCDTSLTNSPSVSLSTVGTS